MVSIDRSHTYRNYPKNKSVAFVVRTPRGGEVQRWLKRKKSVHLIDPETAEFGYLVFTGPVRLIRELSEDFLLPYESVQLLRGTTKKTRSK